MHSPKLRAAIVALVVLFPVKTPVQRMEAEKILRNSKPEKMARR